MSDTDPRSLREELEVRVIALLTGELPEADADELEKILSVDEELSSFRDRMAILIGDVHAARDEVVPPLSHQNMRLSEGRRREIFGDEGGFVRTPEEQVKKWWHLGLLEIAAMLILGGILAAILIPSVGAVRQEARKSSQQIRDEVAFEAPQEAREFAMNVSKPATQKGEVSVVADEVLLERRSSDGLSSGMFNGRVMTESEAIDLEKAGNDWYRSNSEGAGGAFASHDADSSQIVKQAYSNFGLGVDGNYAYDAQAVAEPSADANTISITAGVAQDFVAWKQPAGAIAPAGAPSVVMAPTAGPTMTRGRVSSSSVSTPMDPFAAPTASSGPADPFAVSGRSREVKETIALGRTRYLNGDYDGAAKSFDQVSAQDPNNPEAKLFKNKINEITEYLAEGGEKTRQQMLAQVDQAWERPKVFDADSKVSASPMYVPPTLEQRQQSIVIPRVNFSGMPLSQVIHTLSELSAEYDPTGVGIRMDYTPVNGVDPSVNISLRNLSLDRILQFVTQQVNHEFVVLDEHIQVQAQGQSTIEQMAQERLKNTAQRPKVEMATSAAPISTFSLNVSDVSFKLAQAALETQRIPSAELIRTEEFVNSFSYGDPAPREDEPVTLNWEIAQHPYQHNRQIVRFSLQTQAAGRAENQPLNLNLLVDNSGSMQRPDRRAILKKSLESLQTKLTDQDQLNIILFARQPKLIANAGTVVTQRTAIQDALNYQPEGGTNLEAGLNAAYESAQAYYNPVASNRVILMTDGAANLGDVNSSALAQTVVDQRKQGIALDAYGIGWEDYNDTLLEEISRNGDGRYAFLNSVDSAAADFAEKLAGTLRVAAADVKVQILWNPERVTTYRQIGYDLHQLRAQDFRDNTVDAAEIGEAESGTALYVLQINDDPDVVGGLGKLQVRYRVPATGEYIERSWPLEMPRQIPALEDAPSSLRLAASSAFFAERLANNPYGGNYSFEDLEVLTTGLPEAFPTQPRVVALQNMIQSAQSLFSRFEY